MIWKVAKQFENCWLSRYPRPLRCIHDNGGEFIGWEFQKLLKTCGIEDKAITALNPKANGICERMHQTVGNILRTLIHGHPITNLTRAEDVVDNALATTMHALRAAVSRALDFNSPGAIAFRRDMYLNLPLEADLQALQQRRQLLIDENLRRKNSKRRPFDFQPGQQVLIIEKGTDRKLNPKHTGPFTIQRIFTNGTVAIARTPHVLERLNIDRLRPYFTQ